MKPHCGCCTSNPLDASRVRNLKVGKSLGGPAKGFTVALVMDFENEAGLDAYRIDPRHQEFVQGVAGPLIEDIWRFDFEWN